MPHVTGVASITITPDGHRIVTTQDLKVNPNPKPRTLAASGSDPETWAKIRAGSPGTYSVITHFGGASALIVSRRAIALPAPDFLEPMEANFGALGKDALLGAVRTGAAAATQFCVDTTGAMFTSLDGDFETLAAMLKILVFKNDGWVRFVLPKHLASFQDRFDAQQAERCAVSLPGLARKHEARVTFEPIGQDVWNGDPTLVVFGPIGDTQFIRVVRLALEGEDFRFHDGEWKGDSGSYAPLNRQIVATVTCERHPGVPFILQLDPRGHLHEGGIHVFADGLNGRLFSHNPTRVLGPHGLGWFA